MSIGRGRGIDLTRPAWMTQGESAGAPVARHSPPPKPDSPQPVKPLETTPGLAALAGYKVAEAAAAENAGATREPARKPPQPVVQQSAPGLIEKTHMEAKPTWTEHTAPDGRKYYYNAATRTSTYERPVELGPVPGQGVPAPKTSDWKEFKGPDGRPYYYNSVTQQSVWEMPEEMKSGPAPPAWKEFKAPDGRPYFFNPETGKSLWEEPQELRDYKMSIGLPPADVPVQETEVVEEVKKPEPVPPKVPAQVVPDVISKALPGRKDYESVDEAHTAFKQLLRDKKISSEIAWEEAMLIIIHDPRYGAIRTLHERKQLFAEFAGERKEEEKKEKEEKEVKMKEDFASMMVELDINLDTQWRKAKELVKDDPRWTVLSGREKERMYDDYMYDLERKEKEKEKEKRQKDMVTFRETLEKREDVTVRTSWRQCQELFEDDDCFNSLSRNDRLTVFEDYIHDIEKQEIERRQKERDERRRLERKRRDSFRELLRSRLDDDKLTHRTRWRELAGSLENEPAYMEMLGQSGSTPRDLFDAFMEDVDSLVRETKRKLKDQMKTLSIEINKDSVFEEFLAKFEDEKEFKELNQKHVKWLFDEWVSRDEDKAKQKEEEERRRKRKILERFIDLLKYSDIKENETWADVRPRIERDKHYVDVESDATREGLFDRFVSVRAERAKKRERTSSDSTEEGEDKSAKKQKQDEEGEYDPVKEMEARRASVLEKLREQR